MVHKNGIDRNLKCMACIKQLHLCGLKQKTMPHTCLSLIAHFSTSFFARTSLVCGGKHEVWVILHVVWSLEFNSVGTLQIAIVNIQSPWANFPLASLSNFSQTKHMQNTVYMIILQIYICIVCLFELFKHCIYPGKRYR